MSPARAQAISLRFPGAPVYPTADTDFAFEWGADDKEMEFDPRWFTLADMVVARNPGQIVVGSITGQELIELHDELIANNELTVWPAYKVQEIDPKRVYSVAIPPHVCWKLSERHKNLHNVQTGPELRAQDLWEELFRLNIHFIA